MFGTKFPFTGQIVGGDGKSVFYPTSVNSPNHIKIPCTVVIIYHTTWNLFLYYQSTATSKHGLIAN